ncbi:MAG: tetratricopeptide repeat protein [Candidatus Latescibacterota bacterium]|nr:MAG: tetratricopeptide repeat protein [Candidatus Latescibacterota bacterium]
MTQDRLEALHHQARVYLAAHDFRRLLEVGEKMIAEAPRNAAGYLVVGQAYLVVEQRRRALRFLKSGLARAPRSHEAHYLLAVCYRETRKRGQAKEHIDEALNLAPWDPHIWCEAGMLYLEEDRLAQAIECAQNALQIDPEMSTAHNLLGMALPEDVSGLTYEKVDAFHRALQSDPENPYAYNNLGVEYLRVGRDYKAEKYFRKALRLAPGVRQFRKNLHAVLRERSSLYRVLRGPGDLLKRLMFQPGDERVSFIILLVGVPIATIVTLKVDAYVSPWLFLLVPVALWVIWFVIFWPLIKVYEWITSRDLHLEAGEIDPYLPMWDIRRWSRWVRIPLFLLLLVCVLAGVAIALTSEKMRIGALIVVGVGVLLALASDRVIRPYGATFSDFRWRQMERVGDGSRR